MSEPLDQPKPQIELARNDKGVPFPNHANVVYALQHDVMYAPERLWYDEFYDRVFVAKSPAQMWRDADDTQTAVDMQSRFGIRGVSLQVVASAVQYVARQRTKHCVRDWLNSLTWDETPRIETAFEDYWGAEGTLYTKAASRNFFIGLAARILMPGCKLDTMPVFEGPQGIRKSSALQVLGGQWYSVAHESVNSKDFLQGMRGRLLIEIAELQSFTRAEVNAVKTMMSNQVDDYRPSYGRNVVAYPRQCILAGTTNSKEWGDDETGLRRFWPIRCGDINIPLLTAAREQLFAEAATLAAAGASWWQMPDSTAAIQSSRQFHDEWTTPILTWCNIQPTDPGISIRDILTTALEVDLDKIDKRMQMRVAKILRLNGWDKDDRWQGKTVKLWQKVDSQGGKS